MDIADKGGVEVTKHVQHVFFIIITSNDDLKPSTVLSEQSPTGLIAID